MKKHKKVFSPTLSNVAVTPVAVKNTTGYETDEKLKARLQREEAEAKRQADPIFQHEQRMTKTMLALRKLSSEYWSRPITELTGVFKEEGAKDLTFSVPAFKSEYTQDEAKSAFNEWHDTVFVKSGYEFTESGGIRLVRFGLSQGASAGADMSNSEAWQAAFDHLKDSLKAFQPGDFAREPRRVHVEASAPRPDLEALNIEGNREQAKRARQIVTEDLYSDAAPLHRAWLESLQNNFGGFVPSEDDLKYLYNVWFPRSNKSYLVHESYNAARRHMVSIGRWPETLLTDDERVAREIERGPALATLGFDERWRMMSKVQRQRTKD